MNVVRPSDEKSTPEKYCSDCHPYGWPNGPMPHEPGCTAAPVIRPSNEKDIAARLRALADDLPAKPVHLGLLQQALCGGAAEIEQLRAKLQEHITGGPRNYMHKQMHAQLMEEKDAEIARLKANTPETEVCAKCKHPVRCHSEAICQHYGCDCTEHTQKAGDG